LFSEIEEKKESFEITGYFVSMTSLEEVFLNLQHEELEAEASKAREAGVVSLPPQEILAVDKGLFVNFVVCITAFFELNPLFLQTRSPSGRS